MNAMDWAEISLPTLHLPSHTWAEGVCPLPWALCRIKCFTAPLNTVSSRQKMWSVGKVVLHPTYQWDTECLYLRDIKTQSIFLLSWKQLTRHGSLASSRFRDALFRTRPSPTHNSPTLWFLALSKWTRGRHSHRGALAPYPLVLTNLLGLWVSGQYSPHIPPCVRWRQALRCSRSLGKSIKELRLEFRFQHLAQGCSGLVSNHSRASDEPCLFCTVVWSEKLENLKAACSSLV